MSYLEIHNGALFFKRRQEIMEIRPWGKGLRVRATENVQFTGRDQALTEPQNATADIRIQNGSATIQNGGICAKVTEYGRVTFCDLSGKTLLKEFYRAWEYGTANQSDLDTIIQLRTPARMYRNVGGDNYRISVKFEAEEEERLYGMGQYQMPFLNLKGTKLEMEPKNTQISVPFLLSSRGYGLLWNNPGIGTADFARNYTEFVLQSTKEIDYWITAGDTPAQIEESYADVTGKVPMMPDYGMGFWQCKLRYASQEELLSVAKRYVQKKIPLKVIVIDFFHWLYEGDWSFDPTYWPDPEAMTKELHDMGIRVMVSVWPTVNENSVNNEFMQEHGLLIRANGGQNYAMGTQRFFDATNPEAQQFVWEQCKRNYWDKGVDLFWLDEAEPEYTLPQFDMYRMYEGSSLECGNAYSRGYIKAFYDGMTKAGAAQPLNLIRSAWAGSQRYGALVWSGDVPSTFTYLDHQVKAGLNMGIAGIPWWTADIGGFHGGNIQDPDFIELLIRWFEFGAFCPVMRLHGERDPHKKPLGTVGGASVASGADNEIWSYGSETEKILTYYITLREALRGYIRTAMAEAHEKGTPVIKPLFYDFPEDKNAWECEDSYLFGHEILVSPVTQKGAAEKAVYLPAGTEWVNVWTREVHPGGETVHTPAPIEKIPLFVRKNAEVLHIFELCNMK